MNCSASDNTTLAFHSCSIRKGHGDAAHLCKCGHTWGTAKTATQENDNEGLQLSLILNEKDLNSLYLLLQSSERAQRPFMNALVARGKVTPQQADAIIVLARETTERIKAQIREQFPLVTARADQIQSTLKDFGVI